MVHTRKGGHWQFQGLSRLHVIAWILGQKLDIGHGKHGHHVEFCTANKSPASFGLYLNISGIYVDQSTLSPFILISEVKTSTRPRPKLFPLQQKHQLYPKICSWSYSTPYIKHYKTMCFLMFPSENDSDSLGSDIFGHQNDSPGRSWHLRNWLKTWFRTSAAESAGTKGEKHFGESQQICIDLQSIYPWFTLKTGECIQQTRWGISPSKVPNISAFFNQPARGTWIILDP
jgi:hypothetical protein